MSAILYRNGLLWRCCKKYKKSSRQFGISANKVLTYKIRSLSDLRVGISLCSSYSSKQHVSGIEEKAFQEMMFNRRRQAHCSVIVEVNSYHSLSHLLQYIEKTSKVKNLFYRKLNSEKEYFLVECESISDVRSLLTHCNYFESSDSMPVSSRILKFKNTSINGKESLKTQCEPYRVIEESMIKKKLLESKNVSEQMKELQKCERLSEIDSRLHFFICSQIEDAVSGLFPESICLPFGSAVNGFGCSSGDLDMNLNLNGKQNAGDSLLYFIPKRTLAYDRFRGQRMLETLGNMMETLVPGIHQLNKILKARIPILKFNHDIVKMQCDLTTNNMSGVYMAEVLYLYGEMHPCVRPLVHTVRRWARKNELTSDGAGCKITNFSLILMIIFFLQTCKTPILSPMSRIQYSVKTATTNAEDGNLITVEDNNVDTVDLEPLLMEFFLFCAKFNFENALCINTGTVTPKPDFSSLYIHNPVEKGLNVSKNVTHPEFKKFIQATKNALWQMEKSHDENDKNEQWGILKLFIKQKTLSSEESSRRFEISSLFEKKKSELSQSHANIGKRQQNIQLSETAVRRRRVELNYTNRRKGPKQA